MNHPFFGNRKLVIIYFSIWVAIAAIHIFILTNTYKFAFQTALTDSLVSYVLLAILGIPVWYVVSLAKPGKYAYINQLINHITSAAIILIIWVSASNAICKAIISNAGYSSYLETSLIWKTLSGLFFYLILVLMYLIIIYYKDLQERVSREAKLNEIVKQVELDNLRSQINPHFLFNSLNSISSLTITSPEKAQEMIIKLSDFLRYSITQSDENISTLQMELANIKRYLDIEQVRFGNKLIQEFNIEKECLTMKLPAMLLQPIYENAVKHGVYESTEPIHIFTECKKADNFLELRITNNFDTTAKSKKGAGIGLKNIKERLKLIYGNPEFLKTTIKDDKFIAELLIPQKEN